MTEVFIVGVGTTLLGRFPALSVKDLTAASVHAAIADSGGKLEDIQAAWFCNTRQGVMEGQHGIRGQVALRPLGLGHIPIFNTDNACASSTAGLNLARAYLKAGVCDVALVVGTEKMFFEDKKAETFAAFKGSMDLELGEKHLQRIIDLTADIPVPEGTAAGERSIFMDSYSALARYHMQKYGTTQRQLAAVASKSHWNSQFNPNAQYRKLFSVDQILADKIISYPLTRPMCAPISDGSGAVILCSEAGLKKFDRNRAIRILASQITTGVDHEKRTIEDAAGRVAATRAYEEAGLGPDALDVVELHDATAFGELKQIENMQLCPIGDSGPFSESGNTALGGKIPINTSGGLLSKGHPIGATGAIQIHEIVTQLRGEAGQRQVEGARIGATENGGGAYDGEEAIAAVTILGR